MINSWYSQRMNCESAFQNGGVAGVTGDPNAEPTALPWQIWNQIIGIQSPTAQAQGLQARGVPGGFAMRQGTMSPDSSFSGQLDTARSYIQQIPDTPAKHISLKDAVAGLHNKDPEWLANYTARLYNAGFYADKAYSKGEKPPDGRVVTDNDVLATINLISTAQRYGDTKTIDEILAEFTSAGEGQKKIEAGQGKRTQGQVYNIVTDDPAILRASVTKVAQAVFGRDVTEAEQNALVERMIQQEKAPQMAQVKAGQASDQGIDTILSTARVDAEARMKEHFEAKNPAEAGAYSQLNYYNLLQQAIKGS